MKITKTQLKQIIKEELEVTLANEKTVEVFGEAVEAQIEGQALNEGLDFFLQQIQDPAAWEIMARALAKVITNFAPAGFATVAIMAARRALGYDAPPEPEQAALGDMSQERP